MRQSAVYLNDYVSGRRIGITFHARDYDIADSNWDKEDERLLSFQHIEPFRGRTRYCDLTTQHLRVMIQQVLLHYTALDDADRADGEHPVVSLFNQLVLYLIRCIENATGTWIELLHVNRIGETTISFDFTASMDMNFACPRPKDEPDPDLFTIVVDNTK